MNNPQPNKDYYFDENGLLVFTENYLLQRSYCCGNGCRHCPYEYINVPEEKRLALLKLQKIHDEQK
ncbi:MAG: hypothetical protein KGZ59_06965 [Chitinophagaceae bacterium]|nr:hypothetical protein [Chitinophagaceae bacterium]